MPGRAPSKSTLQRLSDRRRTARLMRAIVDGSWTEVLLGMDKAQHSYPPMRKHSGEIGAMVAKVNLVDTAVDWHATTLCANPIDITAPAEMVDQHTATEQIRQRCLFDAQLGEASEAVSMNGDTALRVDNTSTGVVIVHEDSEVTFATGEDGPDGQPTQWDRRWVIERTDPSDARKKQRYLRIERHTAGYVEQLAFKCQGDDVLQDEMELKAVTLEQAIGPGNPIPEPIKQTGVPFPLIVRLVAKRRRGESMPLLRETDLEIIDGFTASMTRVLRTAEKHGTPRTRVPESMIDKKTGLAEAGIDVIVDPDKEFEYVIAQFDLAGMLSLMNSMIDMLLVRLQMSKSLLGWKPGGGATPDSYDKLRLESSNTIARAHKTAMYWTPVLERLWFIALLLEASHPAKGFSVVQPGVKMRPEIPKDQIEVAREQKELKEAGLTSQRRACIVVHGAQEGEEVYQEILAEESQRADLERQTFSGALGRPMNTGNPKVDDAPAPGGDA